MFCPEWDLKFAEMKIYAAFVIIATTTNVKSDCQLSTNKRSLFCSDVSLSVHNYEVSESVLSQTDN